MGTPEGDAMRLGGESCRRTIDKPFCIGVTESTREQDAAVTGRTPSCPEGRPAEGGRRE
jgi:hypothetical protein